MRDWDISPMCPQPHTGPAYDRHSINIYRIKEGRKWDGETCSTGLSWCVIGEDCSGGLHCGGGVLPHCRASGLPFSCLLLCLLSFCFPTSTSPSMLLVGSWFQIMANMRLSLFENFTDNQMKSKIWTFHPPAFP